MGSKRKMEEHKIKINLIGGFFGQDGYAAHTRQMAKALYALGSDITLDTQVMPGWEQQATNDEYTIITKCLQSKDQHERVHILIGQPHFWPLYWGRPNKGFIGFLIFEGSKTPSGWTEICNSDNVDAIFVPSEHVKDACIAGGITAEKLFIIPEGVNTDLFKPGQGLPEIAMPNTFTFLFNKGWVQGKRDRSGLDITIEAFCETFLNDPNVRLIIKTNEAYGNPINEINEILVKYQNRKCPVHIISKNVPYDKLPLLYNSANAFICPTKAEGFGLNIAEAMACSLPIIVTGYGGHMDFVKDHAYLIDYTMIPATDNAKQYEEAEWAMPNKESLKNSMQHIINDPDRFLRAENGLRKIQKEFQWQHAAEKFIAALNKIYA